MAMKRLALGAVTLACVACGGAPDSPLFDAAPPPADVAVETGPPTIKTSSKIDILFAIDNSFSMDDKQALLLQALPGFIGRLAAPWCVPTNDPTNVAIQPVNGQCASGYMFEFAPINDIHMGIVSSSLGGGGSPDICVVSGGDPTHQDDQGHLLNRTAPTMPGGPEGTIAAAAPLVGNGGNFLAWVPQSEKPNVTDEPSEMQLATDFGSLVTGVGQTGCGLDAQLESWYRFLVQPDPYDQITMSTDVPPKASLTGIDSTVLKERHDFLRPDSLLLVVQLTHKKDSWSDPLWLGGYGWTVRTFNFPGGPGLGAGPRETTECDQPVDPQHPTTTGPNNPDCVSCAFPTSLKPIAKTPISQDPNCMTCAGGVTGCPVNGWYSPATTSLPYAAADNLNVRYVSAMRARYGLDPQWNIQRYVDGLTSPMVPDQAHEVHDSTLYANTQKNCTNPIFAAELPDGSDTTPAALCSLPAGQRDPSLVYYLMIGGAPWQLLAQNPDDTSLPMKRTLDTADWRTLVGTDPSTYQLDGIDPHMIESVAPRAGLPPPTSANNADPINGREWNTLESNAGLDLQYSCIFPLATPLDCTDPNNARGCDCTAPATNSDGPPLCDPNTPTMQINGKAYPTIRELRVAQGLQNQGVVASICPRAGSTDTYFEVLFTRIRNSITP